MHTKQATLIALFAVVATANKKFISHEMTGRIRDAHPGWVAHEPETNPLGHLSNEELLNLVSGAMTTEPRFETVQDQTPDNALPTNWDPRSDARTSKCIHPIRDQAQCGSCWAFGATEALSDRFCLAGQDVILSPQDLVSCDYNNYGCNGGYIGLTWNYLQNPGAVAESCFSYASQSGNAPGCPNNACPNGGAWKKYKCASGTIVNPTTVSAIQTELYNNGPMEGAFTVYQDFFSYSSGVYYHVSGGVAGGHAIKIIGWGVENGLNYWLCANSWNTSWGMQGFFKIKQGDCGINQQVYACKPSVAASEFEQY